MTGSPRSGPARINQPTAAGDEPAMRAGQVAAAAGVGRQTLRYYERRGLIAEPDRTLGGHRQYPPETVRLLRTIKTAQHLGFTLGEVADLLGSHRVHLRGTQGADPRGPRGVDPCGTGGAGMRGAGPRGAGPRGTHGADPQDPRGADPRGASGAESPGMRGAGTGGVGQRGTDGADWTGTGRAGRPGTRRVGARGAGPHGLAVAKLTEVERRIADLMEIRDTLAEAIAAGCDDLATCADTPDCPFGSGQPAR